MVDVSKLAPGEQVRVADNSVSWAIPRGTIVNVVAVKSGEIQVQTAGCPPVCVRAWLRAQNVEPVAAAQSPHTFAPSPFAK